MSFWPVMAAPCGQSPPVFCFGLQMQRLVRTVTNFARNRSFRAVFAVFGDSCDRDAGCRRRGPGKECGVQGTHQQ